MEVQIINVLNASLLIILVAINAWVNVQVEHMQITLTKNVLIATKHVLLVIVMVLINVYHVVPIYYYKLVLVSLLVLMDIVFFNFCNNIIIL